MLNKKIIACVFACFMVTSLTAYDLLLELKGAAFVPTSDVFKQIYDTCGEFGIELTAGNLGHNLYAFTSIDFLTQNGATAELESPTKVVKVDFALGLKYLVPFSCGDFYVGLGVQPSRLFTRNEMTLPIDQSQWSCGGIAKIGAFFDLPRSFFADIFIDYSFVNFKTLVGYSSDQFVTTAVDGCLFGIGFGYRFN